MRLTYLPTAVLVRFDRLAEAGEDFGHGLGVVQVECKSGGWELRVYDDDTGVRRPDPVPMRRVGLPVAPEKVRTVQTAQGMSMDSCIMLLSRYGNMGMDDWWLHVYVMLSRVRTAAQILVYGLPDKSLFEQASELNVTCTNRYRWSLPRLAFGYRAPLCSYRSY